MNSRTLWHNNWCAFFYLSHPSCCPSILFRRFFPFTEEDSLPVQRETQIKKNEKISSFCAVIVRKKICNFFPFATLSMFFVIFVLPYIETTVIVEQFLFERYIQSANYKSSKQFFTLLQIASRYLVHSSCHLCTSPSR